MMKKLLSICIPTYNRAEKLDRQLAWLLQEIAGLEADCGVIISDNCSEDHTQEIIAKWRSRFTSVAYQVNRNDENIGWMRNFVYLINASSSRYTWIVGDDDVIKPGTVEYVVNTLKTQPDLSLIFLNFSARSASTGEVLLDHWLDTNLEDQKTEGVAVFEKLVEKDIGGVIFISATIFQTDIARQAMQQWPRSVNNWGGLAYWNGLCATRGNVLVTAKSYVECTMQASHWQKDPRMAFKVRYKDIPEAYIKLHEIGISQAVCRRMMFKLVYEEFQPRHCFNHVKYILWCLKGWPKWSMTILGVYCFALCGALIDFKHVHQLQLGKNMPLLPPALLKK